MTNATHNQTSAFPAVAGTFTVVCFAARFFWWNRGPDLSPPRR